MAESSGAVAPPVPTRVRTTYENGLRDDMESAQLDKSPVRTL
jgi:hypothetical protein